MLQTSSVPIIYRNKDNHKSRNVVEKLVTTLESFLRKNMLIKNGFKPSLVVM